MKIKFLLVIALVFLFSFSIDSLHSVKANAAVTKVEDLKNSIVGVQAESSAEVLVRELLKDSLVNIRTYESVYNLVNALKDKKIDAAVMDENPARFFAIEDEEIKILPEALESEVYAIAFRKGESDFRNKVNKALSDIISDGTLAKIIEKYIGSEYPDPSEIDYNRDKNLPRLWVGCAASFPPYELRNEKGFVGIDIELCSAIAKKLNMELVISDFKFDNLFDALVNKKIDMICSGLTVTKERLEHFDFSEPYEADSQVIMVLAAN